MPEGADAVVMQEVTQLEGDTVKIFEGIEKNGNVRFIGESVKAKDLVISKGKFLRPQEISMLASLNRSTVMVHRRPKVAVVSTGLFSRVSNRLCVAERTRRPKIAFPGHFFYILSNNRKGFVKYSFQLFLYPVDPVGASH